MNRILRFTDTPKAQFIDLEKSSKRGLAQQVKKTLGHLETNQKHPGLKTHEFTSLKGVDGEKVFEACLQNKTPGAYRIFWHYGPDVMIRNERRAVITIIAITPHP